MASSLSPFRAASVYLTSFSTGLPSPESLPPPKKKKSGASPTVGEKVGSMLRGAKVTGEEGHTRASRREHPQANVPSATRRGRAGGGGGGDEFGDGSILLYFTSRAGPARPLPGVLGGGKTQRVCRSGVLPCWEGVSPLGICPEAETWLLRLQRAENCGTSDQTHTHTLWAI